MVRNAPNNDTNDEHVARMVTIRDVRFFRNAGIGDREGLQFLISLPKPVDPEPEPR